MVHYMLGQHFRYFNLFQHPMISFDNTLVSIKGALWPKTRTACDTTHTFTLFSCLYLSVFSRYSNKACISKMTCVYPVILAVSTSPADSVQLNFTMAIFIRNVRKQLYRIQASSRKPKETGRNLRRNQDLKGACRERKTLNKTQYN